MEEIMLKIENVSKEYKLGQIGGTTLRDELQRRSARRRGLEDPTRKIGAKEYTDGETFMALDGVSFEVRKGERVGIIGHNGAGKSTLLKLISRITAPTGGSIYLNGRVASMLEVGTGFHGELTGRENIYMNGAILGMTKKEIDAKIENIIEFSECRQFIDTPVKRYSSGMYVKLAFSVAAHLDSEIMIMDEVLAVGDMAFQKKCLEKMSDVSKTEGRTILYVSHNMNTIRQLCERVIVMDHGKVVFDGDVEEGIGVYLLTHNNSETIIDLSTFPREPRFESGLAKMSRLEVETPNGILEMGNPLKGKLSIDSFSEISDVYLKITLYQNAQAIITAESIIAAEFKETGQVLLRFEMNLKGLAPAIYTTKLVLCRRDKFGNEYYVDVVMDPFIFRINEPVGFQGNKKWNILYSGFFVGEELKIEYDAREN